MARMPRIVIPGQPLHLIQRGNNRQACFFAEDDYRYYLDCLMDGSARFGVQLHAYVLMTNHVHLLLTPDHPKSPSLLLQSVGRRYVRYVNQVYSRSGTLWEGRFKSTLIDSDNYLLTCSRYIELNPVRAGMVTYPVDYPWSSYRCNAIGATEPLLSPHPIYQSLADSVDGRTTAYRALFDRYIGDDDIQAIRKATESGSVLGNTRFKEQIESALNRRIERHSHGGDRRSGNFRQRRQ